MGQGTSSCSLPGRNLLLIVGNELLLSLRSPDNAKIKQKMIYAASKDGLRKKLDGVYTEIQCTDLSEVSHETVLDKVFRGFYEGVANDFLRFSLDNKPKTTAIHLLQLMSFEFRCKFH